MSRAMVVFESMYGNTEQVALAIGYGLGDCAVVEVGTAPAVVPAEVELLVVGGPTHAHGMSRERTRADAALRVRRPVRSTGPGIREWIAALPEDTRLLAAAFDTRVNGPELLTGSAAKGAAKALRGRGCRLAAAPASFVLSGVKGEPFDRMALDELERAEAWGRTLAAALPPAAR